MINQKANTLAADMNAGKDVTLPWKFEKSITIHNKDLAKNVLDAIFDQPFNVGHKPVAFVVPVNDQQVALVQLLKLHLFPIAKMSNTQKSYIQKTLLSNQQKALMILLMKSFYNHSKIKVYYNRIQ